jgi:hypothetical protein
MGGPLAILANGGSPSALAIRSASDSPERSAPAQSLSAGSLSFPRTLHSPLPHFHQTVYFNLETLISVWKLQPESSIDPRPAEKLRLMNHEYF